MFRLARILIIFILIESLWSQELDPFGRPRFPFRAAKFGFGFIPMEPPPIEPFPPRFGFGWMEQLREAYCRRFCEPSSNNTIIQNVMCFVRCPDVLLQPSSTVTPSTGPTLSPGPTSSPGATPPSGPTTAPGATTARPPAPPAGPANAG